MTARPRIALATIALLLAAPAILPAQDSPQSAGTSASGNYGGQRGQGRNGMGRGVRGKVTAANGSNVTLKTEQGESWTVITTDNTRINIDRQPVKAADVKPGDEVMAMGIVDQDKHEIHAIILGGISAAQAAKLKADLGKTYIVGKVTAINDTRLTVERPDHTSQTITLDETTSLKRGGRPPMEGMGGMGMLFGGGSRRGGAQGAGGERPANENNANSGGMAPGAEGESITLADVKVGDNIAGTGSVKNGSFVPTDLHVLVRPQRGPRPDGAAAANAPTQP